MSNQLYNDQELSILVNSGIPHIRADQDLMVIVEQRLVPAIIHTNDDQELIIVIAATNKEVKGYFRKDYWLFQANGPVISQAEVWVCNQPCVTSGGYNVVTQQGVTTVTGNVPTNLATVYKDPNGLAILPQPLVPDAFGHTYFYTLGHASGINATPSDFYTVVSYVTTGSRSNQLQATLYQTLPDQFVGHSLLKG